MLAKTLPHLDDALGRLSCGRQSIPGLFTGLPVVDVTTTGRKSGLRRTSHLIPIPISDTLALLGTNFGQPATPAWVFNLEADPRASVVFRRASVEVVARPAPRAESEVVMATATGIYGGYAKYRQRTKGRSIRIFVLEPSVAAKATERTSPSRRGSPCGTTPLSRSTDVLRHADSVLVSAHLTPSIPEAEECFDHAHLRQAVVLAALKAMSQVGS